MKTSLLRLGAVFGISIGALAAPHPAFAANSPGGSVSGVQVFNCHFSGLMSEAGFQAGSLATTETIVYLSGFEGQSLGGSNCLSSGSDVNINITQMVADPSSPKGMRVVAQLWGDVPGSQGLSIDKSLSSASISGVVIPVSGYDANGPVSGRSITVNAAWTGTGTISRFTYDDSYRSGAFSYQERGTSTYRAALAAASALDGSTDWVSGATETFADIQSSSDMSLAITRS